MQMYSSIRKQAGFLVLKKIFPQLNTKKLKRRVCAYETDLPLDKWQFDDIARECDGISDCGHSFTLYGLELGVFYLKTQNSKDLKQAIEANEELKARNFLPTHIATVFWMVRSDGVRHERVGIYKLPKKMSS